MDKEIVIYLLVGIAIFTLLILLIVTFFPSTIQAWIDSGKTSIDKCKPKPGYTAQSWMEHMGHHPDIYEECLS